MAPHILVTSNSVYDSLLDSVSCDVVITEYSNIRIKWVKSLIRPYTYLCFEELKHLLVHRREGGFVHCEPVP